MSDAFSTPRNRITTIVLLVLCVLSAIAAVLVGIDDNLPGVFLALFAGIAFVLAFSHPWRSIRKFLFLLLASVLGFVFLIILNIALDFITRNPATSDSLRNLLQGRAGDAGILVLSMLSMAAFLVAAVGSLVLFIRSRRKK